MEKNDNSFCVKFFIMCFSLVKAKILQKRQYWRIFSFFLQMSLFSKSLVSSRDIRFSLKSVSFKLTFGKKISFYAKSVSFLVNEWIFKYSDKIMSCKLWSKVTSVFLNINFCAKMSILGKHNWSSVRNVDFLKLLCTTTESEYLIGKHAYFQKILTFCVNVYIH